MQNRKYIMSIDCGTQSSRAFVWDLNGKPVSGGQAGFEFLNPRLGWYEQDAGQWWPATCTAIRQALKTVNNKDIAALGITHQRETFVPISRERELLRYALPHMDERCSKQVEFVKRKVGSKRVQKKTGKYPSYVYSLYDILWIIENEPHIAERVYKYLEVQSFLMMHLIDRIVTSYVSADPTSLINAKKRTWDLDLMKSLGLKPDQFPELCPPCEVIGNITKKAAKETGLPEGLPVISGAGDGICACGRWDLRRPWDEYHGHTPYLFLYRYLDCSRRLQPEVCYRHGIPYPFTLHSWVLQLRSECIRWFHNKLVFGKL
jgi:xylulokinase